MKTKIALFTGLLLLFLTSCNNKQKELELNEKEKAIVLKEKELALRIDSINKAKKAETKTYTKTNTVATNKKELRYLFYDNGGIIGYFNDGTKAGCPRCDFCKSNVDELFAQESMGTYTDEEVLNEINENGTEGWALIDYEWKMEVPQF